MFHVSRCRSSPYYTLTHRERDETILWSVRAIADLAANHPNNQTKLGVKGACDGLVRVLRGVLITPDNDDVSMGDVNLR